MANRIIVIHRAYIVNCCDMHQVLLTFVVPCFNVQKYVQSCLDSIYACGLPQEYFEVVCVNDCSTDGTGGILDTNRKRHNNLRVINHEINKGLGEGRNTGISEAKGRYIWFVDSDDEVVNNGIPSALDMAVTENLDVLCFNYRRIDEAGNVISDHEVFKKISVTDGGSFSKRFFPGGIVNNMGYVWRFLSRTDFLRLKLLLFHHYYWEDTVFMPKSVLLAERVASAPYILYSYRANSDSISGTFGKDYPAKLIYDFSFCTGSDLLRFSEGVEDEELRAAFHKVAVKKYLNGFVILLLRTNKKERKCFYNMVKENKHDLKPFIRHLAPFNRVLLTTPVLVDCCSMLYKATH